MQLHGKFFHSSSLRMFESGISYPQGTDKQPAGLLAPNSESFSCLHDSTWKQTEPESSPMAISDFGKLRNIMFTGLVAAHMAALIEMICSCFIQAIHYVKKYYNDNTETIIQVKPLK